MNQTHHACALQVYILACAGSRGSGKGRRGRAWAGRYSRVKFLFLFNRCSHGVDRRISWHTLTRSPCIQPAIVTLPHTFLHAGLHSIINTATLWMYALHPCQIMTPALARTGSSRLKLHAMYLAVAKVMIACRHGLYMWQWMRSVVPYRMVCTICGNAWAPWAV